MRIVIVGAIFHRSEQERSRLQPTTETMLADGLEENGHEVVRLSPRDWMRGRRLANDPTVDAIHLHHPSLLTTFLAFAPARVPLVYTPHRTNLPPKLRHAVGHRRMFGRARQVVTLSPLERQHVADTWGITGDRNVVIPNGFDDSQFPYVERNRPQNDEMWNLLFVGQLIEPKQPTSILEAIDHPELGNVRVRYVTHNPRLKDELVQETTQRELGDRVTFVGQRHGEELFEEYRDAHIFVLPSNDLEALPSVITESMFTGLPVVAGDVGGIRWQLNGLGRCIKDIDAQSLRGGLLDMMTNYHGAVAAGRSSAGRAREIFSKGEMVQRHIDLYKSLVTQGA